MVSPGRLVVLLAFFASVTSTPIDICSRLPMHPMCRRSFPPSNTDVKHICVDNPNLASCGPDFCEKNPDAPGCPKTRRLAQDNGPIVFSEKQKRYCAKNPDDKFCQLAPRSFAPNNVVSPAPSHLTAGWKLWKLFFENVINAPTSTDRNQQRLPSETPEESYKIRGRVGTIRRVSRIFGKVRRSNDDVQTQIRYA